MTGESERWPVRGPATHSSRPNPASGDNPVDSVDNTDTRGVSPRIGTDKSPSGRSPSGEQPSHSVASATQSDNQSGSVDTGGLAGSDLARAALQAAREAAGARRASTPTAGRRRNSSAGSSRRRWSGAGADDRDPQPFGRLVSRIAADRGWAGQLAGGQVFGRWAELVGADIAEHVQPVRLENGELTVAAESTAWATQLRLLQRQIVLRIAAGVGDGVVTRIKIQGPSAPSWRFGQRHVRGRGPRDTYG